MSHLSAGCDDEMLSPLSIYIKISNLQGKLRHTRQSVIRQGRMLSVIGAGVAGLCYQPAGYQEQQLPPPGRRRLCCCSHSLIRPLAQPTPAATVMAVTGQFSAQAPHSIQASRSLRAAFFPASENTWCGQTSRQRPQPMQAG